MRKSEKMLLRPPIHDLTRSDSKEICKRAGTHRSTGQSGPLGGERKLMRPMQRLTPCDSKSEEGKGAGDESEGKVGKPKCRPIGRSNRIVRKNLIVEEKEQEGENRDTRKSERKKKREN